MILAVLLAAGGSELVCKGMRKIEDDQEMSALMEIQSWTLTQTGGKVFARHALWVLISGTILIAAVCIFGKGPEGHSFMIQVLSFSGIVVAGGIFLYTWMHFFKGIKSLAILF
ncbi:MAG: hypothetical protein QMD08_08350, partial [Actinomycetota bacterium]|nr:hypothetical protein [Actinomycetota bacterium]